MKTRFPVHSWRPQVALDVGTSTIRVASGRRPIMEHHSRLGDVVGVSGGAIVDDEAVTKILKPLLDKTRLFGIVKPCVLACAPSDATAEERDSLYTAIMRAGASSVWIIPEPLAAAVGAGIDVSSPYAHMVVDIGEGVTDCALIKMSRIQTTAAIRVGCAQIREALAVCDSAAEGIVQVPELLGGDSDGNIELSEGLQSVLNTITGLIDRFLKDLRPEEGCEVIESGILLTGGGALIPGLNRYLEQRFGITVITATQPRTNVVEGARAIVPVVVMLNLLK